MQWKTLAPNRSLPLYNRLIGEKRTDPNEDVNKKLLKAARILERMVNQNTYNDIALGEMDDSEGDGKSARLST